MRITITLLLLASLVVLLSQASAQSESSGLASRVAQLEAQVEALTAALEETQEILKFVRVEEGEMNGLTGPHWIFEGANVHVRSGSGNTFDNCGPRDPNFPNCDSLTGLGNLIVGYNEQRPSRLRASVPREIRTGSNNLVVGEFHSYSSFGGFVVGVSNRVTSANASVSGGSSNLATGQASSVCGGQGNEANGTGSSVGGGLQNVASGNSSSVSGGNRRTAPNEFNWAAGSLLEPN